MARFHFQLFVLIRRFFLSDLGFLDVYFVHLFTNDKLSPQSIYCFFFLDILRPRKKNYRHYHPPSKHYYMSVDVIFFENVAYYSNAGTDLQQN